MSNVHWCDPQKGLVALLKQKWSRWGYIGMDASFVICPIFVILCTIIDDEVQTFLLVVIAIWTWPIRSRSFTDWNVRNLNWLPGPIKWLKKKLKSSTTA